MSRLRLHARGAEKAIVNADIKEFRPGPLLRFSYAHLLVCDDSAYSAVGVIEIAGDDRLLRADDDASGFEAHLDSVGAQVTLRGRIRIRIDVERIVRAGLHARLAADAAIAVEIDDAVGAAIERYGRADLDAGRVVTMVAAENTEVPPRIGIFALLYVLDPRAVNSERDVVLFLTGDRTRVAADAAVVIDDKTVTHGQMSKLTE